MPNLKTRIISIATLVYVLMFSVVPLAKAEDYMGPGDGPAGVLELQNLLLRIISLSVPLAFIVLTVIIFYAGFKFITSSGDQKNLATARQIIVQAVLGIAFLALAWIVLLIIGSITGRDITNLNLKIF